MVTLPSGNNAEATSFSALKMKLPRHLDRSLVGFGSARSEKNTPALTHSGWRQGQQTRGKLFRRCGMKLGGVGKGKLCRLQGHRLTHRENAVTDVDYSRLTGGVKVLFPVGGVDPTALAADCLRIVLGKTSRKERRMIGHGAAANCADSTRLLLARDISPVESPDT